MSDSTHLRKRYILDRTPLDQLARELGVGRPRLVHALEEAGIPLRRRGKPAVDGLNDSALLFQRYVVEGASVLDLATELHVARKTLREALDRAGIQRRSAGRQLKRAALADGAWLAEEYQSKTAQQIARELHVSQDAVRAALHRHGIPIVRQRRTHRVLAEPGWLRMKLDQGYSQADIARLLEVNPSTVSRAVRRRANDRSSG